MGAARGEPCCIANAVRICLRYNNYDFLENGYGINMIPLTLLALDVYAEDPCACFQPKIDPGSKYGHNKDVIAKMHKAIAIIQFKEEAAIFKRRPEWQMQDRCLFEHIDYNKGICTLDGKKFEMNSCHFPTIDPDNPNALTQEEALLMQKLHHSFRVCEKLHKHIRTLLSHGCMYTISNSNLLFHASCPLNDDGTLKEVEIYPGIRFSGKNLMHHIGMIIRSAFSGPNEEYPREYARDYFLYLWCGKDSPLFDKSKMATFERYFLKDKDTYKEEKGNYFKLRDSAAICDYILDAFGVKG
jgi:fructose-1,6-bisphosphatase-3